MNLGGLLCRLHGIVHAYLYNPYQHLCTFLGRTVGFTTYHDLYIHTLYVNECYLAERLEL